MKLPIGAWTHGRRWKTFATFERRPLTANLATFSAQEVETIFGAKIEEQIDVALEEKVTQITANVSDDARRNELQNGLRTLLRLFLARIEREMTVDIRYLPPSEEEGATDVEGAEDREARQNEIREIASTLVFPRPVGDPVLKLEATNDEAPAGKSQKPK